MDGIYELLDSWASYDKNNKNYYYYSYNSNNLYHSAVNVTLTFWNFLAVKWG